MGRVALLPFVCSCRVAVHIHLRCGSDSALFRSQMETWKADYGQRLALIAFLATE